VLNNIIIVQRSFLFAHGFVKNYIIFCRKNQILYIIYVLCISYNIDTCISNIRRSISNRNYHVYRIL